MKTGKIVLKEETETSKNIKSWLLSVLRIAIGWHFLYEGITKIIAGNWSSAPYLAGSRWIFAPVFTAMAANAGIIYVVDFLNVWGMILVGLGLMLGLFTRWASAWRCSHAFLLFYFLSSGARLYDKRSC